MFLSKYIKHVYPCKPQLYYIKVGCKGVFITWTCLHDDNVISRRSSSEFAARKQSSLGTSIILLVFNRPTPAIADKPGAECKQTLLRYKLYQLLCQYTIADMGLGWGEIDNIAYFDAFSGSKCNKSSHTLKFFALVNISTSKFPRKGCKFGVQNGYKKVFLGQM